MKKFTKYSALLLALLMLVVSLCGCLSGPSEPVPAGTVPAAVEAESPEPVLDEYGSYTSKEDVALYIFTYGCLPQNFITKDQARQAGWSGGSLEPYCPGMCIGGDPFGNREGLLPKASGRTYYECDIDFDGSYRNGKRIVYSNDGLIYYTEDHYESFQLLYGEDTP